MKASRARQKRRLDPTQPVVFLDFDGVLHPDEAYLMRGGPVLRHQDDPSITLFHWAPILTELLEPYPQTQIVLSTSWVRMLRFSAALAHLPMALQARVVGATWHSQLDQHEWSLLSRGEEVLRYARRHALVRWVAIDDDAAYWPRAHLANLVQTDGTLGLSDPGVQDDLKEWLARLNA